MSKAFHLSIASCVATILAAGCVGAPEPTSPPTAASGPGAMYDEGAARFVTSALERGATDESYRYSMPSQDGAARQLTIGVANAAPLAPGSLVAASEVGFEWCHPESPHVAVSKTVWCQTCNKSDAEDCARQWAFTNSKTYCATRISTSDGASACAPDSFDGTLCVDTTSQGVTSSVQVGSDTACGVWPFRHAEWKVTYNVTGDCGYTCRSSP